MFPYILLLYYFSKYFTCMAEIFTDKNKYRNFHAAHIIANRILLQ